MLPLTMHTLKVGFGPSLQPHLFLRFPIRPRRVGKCV